MNIHKNARLTPVRREEMARDVIQGRLSKASAAQAFGVSAKVVARWVERFEAEGRDGMADRSSRPRVIPRMTRQSIVKEVVALRRQRLTGRHIAKQVGISPATVSRVLKRAGLSRLKDIEPAEPVRRYERAHPGELIHLDIKTLGRFDAVGHRITGDRTRQSSRRGKGWGAGWEHVHVSVDDASRIAFTDITRDQTAASAVAFLKGAIAYYASLGITVSRVMTDNGPCYTAFAFQNACRELGLRHIRTRPYTPKTNGKAERFIQSALREWAYARAYQTSDHRAHDLPVWTHMYNWHRPHGSLNSKPPISRLGSTEDNLLRLHI
jgi:transposase InsO family protein